ncbi:MAG: polyphosphate kinase 2 family protein [Planctomycetota bacterium]
MPSLDLDPRHLPAFPFRLDDYRVTPNEKVDLAETPTRYEGPIDKEQGRLLLAHEHQRMIALQEKLYAEGKQGLLIVFQAMDAAGKDSTVRHVFNPLDAAGCHVTSFKSPSKEELAHDYLWRVHHHTPARGDIAVFNRSHYEEVLIVRVKGWQPKKVIQRRFDHLNCFERMLADEGTTVVKFFLHISKDYQKQRLQRRLDRPEKHWKFNPEDLLERAHWDDYQHAFEDVFEKCSPKHAPWHIIPAERRWARNLIVARIVADTMEAMDPRIPEPAFDPTHITIE